MAQRTLQINDRVTAWGDCPSGDSIPGCPICIITALLPDDTYHVVAEQTDNGTPVSWDCHISQIHLVN